MAGRTDAAPAEVHDRPPVWHDERSPRSARKQVFLRAAEALLSITVRGWLDNLMPEDSASTFSATTRPLTALLGECAEGSLQLPDFQRSWVWDEERIRSLIASISRGFPVGAIMTLRTGGAVRFQPRPVEGTNVGDRQPDSLLLDGQQRMTSLYQVLLRGEPVRTVTPRQQRVVRWFYIDIRRALDPSADRDDAIVSVPESKRITSDFGRHVDLDLTTREKEIDNLLFPVHELLSPGKWQTAYIQRHMSEDFESHFEVWKAFEANVISSFANYLLPVIELDKSTSKEAVCVVFEKVNTGGKALDAFELITATYAADNYQLRDDWYGSAKKEVVGREQTFRGFLKLPSAPEGVLSGVKNTDFLQAVGLFHTRDVRREAENLGKTGRELPQVSVTRQSLLNLPLDAYQQYQEKAQSGFELAAKFLINIGIYRVRDLPYQSQIVPLAAILAELGQAAEPQGAQDKIARWYWNGVFGELYGSSTETRIARDFVEVPNWVRGGDEPTTVHDSTVRADRLLSMRMRLSAAYKGVNALLMKRGAEDFRTGQPYTNTVFFDENVDIHHIFPQDWCKGQGIAPSVFDSIINKTPLAARTNRIIGGSAPSVYLEQLEKDAEDSTSATHLLDGRLSSHYIDPRLLRADDFDGFMKARHTALVKLIESATGKPVIAELDAGDSEEFADPEPEDVEN